MDSSTDWACLICCELSGFKVLGKCNHPICLSCVVRQRDICEQKYCPVCREVLEKVIGVFQYTQGTYEDLEKTCKISGSKPGYKFEDRKVLNAFRELFAMRCKVCKRDCKTIQSLEDHLKREHNKFFCQICKDNLKVFIKDLPVYSKDALRTHRVKGEESDSSMKGHPLCEFCQERFLDNEVLHLHLRKNHFWCHLCDGQAFYCTYADLRLHFQQNHYLCERGECAQEQLTNVFRSPIDLQAHVTSRHVNELGKAQQKQMRQIQHNFTSSRAGNRTRDMYSRGPHHDRPSSSRLNNVDITDLGSWDDTHSSNRGNSSSSRALKAKPSLGNRPRMRQPPPERPERPVQPDTSTNSTARDLNSGSRDTNSGSRDTNSGSRDSGYLTAEPHSAGENGKQRKGGNKGRDRSKSPVISYRRDNNSSQKRPSERNKEVRKEQDIAVKNVSPSVSENAPFSTPLQSSTSAVQSVSSSSEVGRPPPVQLEAQEPDVGYPPGDVETPLGDDGDFRRKRGGKKSKGGGNQAYPPLGRGVKAKETASNTAWGKGAPNLGPQLQSKSKQSRKQQKILHSENFDDELDFQWMDTEQKNKPNQNKAKQKVKKKPADAETKQPKASSSQPIEPAVHVNETNQDRGGIMEELSEIAEQLSSACMDQPEKSTPSTVAPASARVCDEKTGAEDFPMLAPSVAQTNEARWVPSTRPVALQVLDSEANYPPLPPPKSKAVLAGPGAKRSAGRGSRSWGKNNQSDPRDMNNYPPLGSSNSKPLSLVNGHGQTAKLSAPAAQSAPGSRSGSPPVLGPANPVNEESTSRLSRTPPPDLRTILNLPPSTDPAPRQDVSSAKPLDSSATSSLPPSIAPTTIAPITRHEISSANPPPDFNSIILGHTSQTNGFSHSTVSSTNPTPNQHSNVKSKRSPLHAPSYDVPSDIPEVSSRLNSSPALQLTATKSTNPGTEGTGARTSMAENSELPDSAPKITPELNGALHSAHPAATPSVKEPVEVEAKQVLSLPPGITIADPQCSDNTSDYPSETDRPPGIPPHPLPNLADASSEVNLPPGIALVKKNGVTPSPPGLDQPPGFGGPPPGMGNTGVQNRIVTQKSDVDTKLKEGRYLPVQDANRRNIELLNRLRNSLGPVLFEEFETAVKAFRGHKMDAPSFTRICRMFLYRDVSEFDSTLEELTVLLPDIGRQNDLYRGLGMPPNLIQCLECMQIVKRGELLHHTIQHNISIDSPGFSFRTKFELVSSNDG